MSLLSNLSIILLSIAVIIQTYWLTELGKRLRKIEHATFLRDWLQAIEDGESPSDLAYMREKGFLK